MEVAVAKPEEIMREPEKLTHEIQDGVAVIPLSGNSSLTVKVEKYKKYYMAIFKVYEADKLLVETEIPAKHLHKYTRPKYDMLRSILKDKLPKINGKKLTLGKLFSYIQTNIIQDLIEYYEKKEQEKKLEKKRKYEEFLREHWSEIQPIIEDPVSSILEVVNFYHIGDMRAKHQLIPVIASRFLPREYRLHSVIQGPSSAGKNNLVNTFMKITPKRWWKIVTRMTKTAVDYLQGNIGRTILYIQEYEGMNQSSYSVRITLSEGKLIIMYTRRNEKTGELETVERTLEGTPVLITTTTRVEIDEDMENRTFYISIDTSEEQTRKIIWNTIERASNPEYIEKEKEIKEKARRLRIFFRTLKGTKVIIPKEYLEMLAKNIPLVVRARRDFKKLTAVIMAMAALNQHKRQKKVMGGEEYIIATREDYEYAKRWFLGELRLQMKDVRDPDKKIVECVAKLGLNPFRAVDKELQKCVQVGYRSLKRYLDHLVRIGYAVVDEKKRPFEYSLTEAACTELKEELGVDCSSIGLVSFSPERSNNLLNNDMSFPVKTVSKLETKAKTNDKMTSTIKERENFSLMDVYAWLKEKHGSICLDYTDAVRLLKEEYGLTGEEADIILDELARNGLLKKQFMEDRLTLCIQE